MEESLLTAQLKEKFEWFKVACENFEGGSISHSERKRMGVTQQSEFTYGEVEFIHMQAVFELCDIKQGEVFWDLGCGAGKCMLAAALLFP